MGRAFKLFVPLSPALGLWLWGCARFPPEGEVTARDLLIVEMRTAEPIDPNFYYYVAIDTNGDPADGPLPVVAGPYFGNGWGTGSFTHFVEYHGGVFDFLRGGPDNRPPPVSLGPPFLREGPSPEAPNRLRIGIDLETLRPSPASPLPTQVEVNLITVNRLVLPGDVAPPDRAFDGLGETGNIYLSVGTTVERVRTNRTDPIEPQGDTPVGAIDIVDWTIEVRKGR